MCEALGRGIFLRLFILKDWAMGKMPGKYIVLTGKEAANYLGFSESTLRTYRVRSKKQTRNIGPPYIKAGKTIRYLKEDLDAWLEKHRQKRNEPG